jgi:preprotein translocase subunit SecD
MALRIRRVAAIAALLLGIGCSQLSESTPPAGAPSVDLQIRPVIQLVDAHDRTWRVLRPTCHGSETAVADCMASMHGTDRVTLRDGSRKYVLGPIIADGSDVASAAAAHLISGGNGAPIDVQLTPAATQALASATRQAVGATPPKDKIAMIVDGQIASAPTLRAPITSGAVQITGGFTGDRAKAIEAGLNAGD